MKLWELGEFGLIDLLAKTLEEAGASSLPGLLVGIGDDAAAWRMDYKAVITTTDTMVYGVHFTWETITWRDLGWKALAVNLSDIAAMGGKPLSALVTLGLERDLELEDIRELYLGLADCALRYGVAILGGDIVHSPVLFVTVSLTGTVPASRSLLLRSGGRPGEAVAVTGYLGSAAAGLKIMLEGREAPLEGAAFLMEAHRRPQPRLAEGAVLAERGLRAAMDISDGLMGDLAKFCQASGLAARISLHRVPVLPLVKALFPEEWPALALSGGEDYELLFSGPEDIIAELAAASSSPITVIGCLIDGEPGQVTLLDEADRPIPWGKSGWDHFRR